MIHPNDDNGDVLRRMETGGDDLSRARNVDFSVVFPDKLKADEFAAQFRRKGYKSTVEHTLVKETHPWDVLVVRHMVPSHPGITGFEEELQNAANPLGGYNDGWGCFRQVGEHKPANVEQNRV